MKKLQHVGAMVGTIALAASVLGAGSGIHLARAGGNIVKAASYSFLSVSYPHDTFTQLLGINNAGIIAGYHGDGTNAPNKGFVLNLASKTPWVSENYPNSAQTQVFGPNKQGDTAGFYIDSANVTHGFTDIGGTFTTVDVPGTSFNQLLGINDQDQTAGYYQFGTNNIFQPITRTSDGTFTLPPIPNAQATGVNNSGLVSGFYIDSVGTNHGFLWQPGSAFKTIDFPGSTFTQALGLNNVGQVVGQYIDANNVTHGFLYDIATQNWQSIDGPGATATTINGINDLGTVVGFYATNAGSTGCTAGQPCIGLVGRASSTTVLSASPNPALPGRPVTFRVTMSPSTATGIVRLVDANAEIAVLGLTNGVTQFTTSKLAVGSHTILALYAGDGNLAPSATTLEVTIQ